MPWLRRLRDTFAGSRLEEDLDDELRAHLDQRTDEYIRHGMTPEEARREAHRRFGSVTLAKERSRDVDSLRWLDDLRQDLRFGIRLLRRNPGFTAVSVVTLALSIGTNTAIFSIVNATLIQPLPFKDPARLVAVLDARPSAGVDWLFVSPNRYEEWVRRNSAFAQMAAAQTCYFRTEERAPQLLQGGCVSASFFPMLGVRPALGRLFTTDEDVPGGRPVVVLSYACWQQHFDGDPKVLGRTIRRTANDAVFTIVGVLPPDFKFATDEFALWAPLNTDPNYRDRDEHSLLVFAKLNATVTPEQAQAMMNGVARQLAEEFPKSEGWSITVKPLQQFYAGVRNVRQTLLVLLAAVALLLAIACLNIANLLLARGAVRTKETVVRLAIGATQQRLARQLIAESVLLGLFGGLAGFLLARLTFASLIAAAPHIPSFRPHAIRLNYEAFAFAIAVSILASVAFGLAPALWASRTELSEHLREAGRVRRGAADTRMRHLLVTGELAVTVVLLAGAGLLLETFRNLETDALGFNTSHIVTAGVCCLDETHYRTERDSSMFYRQLFERLRSTPGVESVSGATDLPLRHVQGSGSPFDVRERPAQVPGEQPTADLFFVEPTYFRTLGIAVTRGRVFADDDDEARAPVAVINESLARRLWTDRDPIGQEIHPLDRIAGSRWYRIIGVVADTKERGLGTDVQPTIYRSYYQSLARFTFLLIRTRSAPGPMLPALKEALESVSRGLPVNDFRTLDDALAESVSAQRFSALLLALFAALALGLASVGVYGVTAYTVVQRTREVGIRMALGASTREIRRMVLREGLMHATVGLTVGTLGAFAFARYLRALLYGVAAGDPLTLAIPVLLLFLTTLAACSIPAWRAARVDPIRALRCE